MGGQVGIELRARVERAAAGQGLNFGRFVGAESRSRPIGAKNQHQRGKHDARAVRSVYCGHGCRPLPSDPLDDHSIGKIAMRVTAPSGGGLPTHWETAYRPIARWVTAPSGCGGAWWLA